MQGLNLTTAGSPKPNQEMAVTPLPASRFGLNRYGFSYFFTSDRSSMVSGSIHQQKLRKLLFSQRAMGDPLGDPPGDPLGDPPGDPPGNPLGDPPGDPPGGSSGGIPQGDPPRGDSPGATNRPLIGDQ